MRNPITLQTLTLPKLLLLMLLLISGTCCLDTVCYAQSENPYVGSRQYFDISGTWVNEGTGKTRVAKMDINKTIVNTYRIVTYYALFGGAPKAIGGEQPLVLSEEDVAYRATVNQSTIMVYPFRINGMDKLACYSLVIDPDGRTLSGKTLDIMVREQNASSAIGPSMQSYEMAGYWVNEWEDNMNISRLQVRQDDGEVLVEPFRIVSNKHRSLGEHSLGKAQEDGTQVLDFAMNSVDATMFIRPVRDESYRLLGLDVIVEEIFEDGIPKKIYRQFFVPDPEAQSKLAFEAKLRDLEGKWLNLDPTSPTHSLEIYDSDLEIFAKCDDPNPTKCPRKVMSLGRELLVNMGNGFIGYTAEAVTAVRTTEIDTDLDMNQAGEKPKVIALNILKEDKGGTRPPVYQTEIFIRKGVTISPDLYE